MPSMSYCKFENTVIDLIACRDAIIDNEKQTNDYEIEARKQLIEICNEITEHCKNNGTL